MPPTDDAARDTGSAWASVPPALLGGSAVLLLVFHQLPAGYALIVAGLAAAWLCDARRWSAGLLPDLTAVASGVLILSLSDLAADLSDAGMLRFTLVLPTAVDDTNATQVSDDRRVLTWKLPLGEETTMDATVTYLNPVKAAGWLMVLLVVGGVGNAYYRKRKRMKGTGA